MGNICKVRYFFGLFIIHSFTNSTFLKSLTASGGTRPSVHVIASDKARSIWMSWSFRPWPHIRASCKINIKGLGFHLKTKTKTITAWKLINFFDHYQKYKTYRSPKIVCENCQKFKYWPCSGQKTFAFQWIFHSFTYGKNYVTFFTILFQKLGQLCCMLAWTKFFFVKRIYKQSILPRN